MCKIVTAPDLDATVLHDLASGVGETTWVQGAAHGFTLGAPSWADGPAGVIEGTRQIVLPVMIDGDTRARDAQLLSLSRALTRPYGTAYLLWQLNADAAPTWFKLYPTRESEIDWSRVFDASPDRPRSTYRLDLSVTAKAFGIGERTEIAPFTILAQQAQAGVLLGPDILGSVPAPLTLDLKPSGGWAGWRQLVNVTAVHPSSSFTGSRFWLASAFSPSAGVTANGASYQWDEAVSSGADGGEIISGPAPTTVTPGTYRILVLVRHAGNALGGGWIKAGTRW